MVKIKLCGFTREEDIEKAVSLGVDYVGIILYPKSPRYVKPERFEQLLRAGDGVKKVAVMVNPSPEEVENVLQVGFDLVQLHGEESLDFARRLGMERVIKAFGSCPGLEVHEDWKKAHAVLIDACSGEAYGGTGLKSDWKVAKELMGRGFRVFLAGGLTPESVKQAIRVVRPYAVDVSSGIEVSPGIKDHRKMEEFVHAVKNASED
ncbi:MAG: phosphoribosylanthranilate isomerase [Aquificaceae bacterium]|uniref:phosphoribosylanthranilate isomerase n=1 Tax=Hydrogenobacter sp. Uz 6-8 TaxID=3384828 RepID=UPI00309A1F68